MLFILFYIQYNDSCHNLSSVIIRVIEKDFFLKFMADSYLIVNDSIGYE